eukprot:16428638-Heterocapsa_arctica.AAC.2
MINWLHHEGHQLKEQMRKDRHAVNDYEARKMRENVKAVNDDELRKMREDIKAETEATILEAYQYDHNLIVTAQNNIETREQQLRIQEKMIREDKEVSEQLLLELQHRPEEAASSSTDPRRPPVHTILASSSGDRASASAAPRPPTYTVLAMQGGNPAARQVEATRRASHGTAKNESRDLKFWYSMPLGYIADQAGAHGWRLQSEYYTQRSGLRRCAAGTLLHAAGAPKRGALPGRSAPGMGAALGKARRSL